ncbi:MAG: TolC family protein, partial [Planctomycetota bacterium]
MSRCVDGLGGAVVLALCTALAGCAGPGFSGYTPASVRPAPAGARAPLAPGVELARSVTGTMTLEACVREALRAHRSMRRARRGIAIAGDRVREAWSRALPRIEAQWAITSRSNDPGVRSGGLSFVGADRTIRTAGATLVIPLYEIVAGAPLRKAAKLGRRITTFDAQRAAARLRLEVSRTYYRTLEAERSREVSARSIAVLEAERARIGDLARVGLATDTDVLAVDVALARRRQERIRAEHNVALARAALNRLLLRDLRTPLRLRDVERPAPLPAGGLAALQAAAVRSRPELRSLRDRIEAARADWAYTRTRLGPQIDLVGGYRRTSDTHQLHPEWWEAGLQLRLPVFDGGSTWAQIARKRKEIEQAIDRYEQAVDDVVLEVQQA